MKQVLKYTGYLLLVALAAYMFWRFWFLIVWILVAAVISFLGHPLVRFFDKLKLGKWKMPHSLSTVISLMIILVFFMGLLAVFVPLIMHQSETLSKIDVNKLAQGLQGPVSWLDEQMHAFGLLPFGQTLQDFLVVKVKSLVNIGSLTSLLNSFFSVAGNFIIGMFSIVFIAFFFIKDEKLFTDGLLMIVPVKHHKATRSVITESKEMLMRYFIGILCELLCVMLIITLGLWALGVDNALLIGFFGGIMNIIPYLGPILGTTIGMVLGVTSALAAGSYQEMLPLVLKLIGVFVAANFIDNNILVPFIYSSSVKAHPLEIFFVIIIGGSLAGILGMLFAVPVYTVLRVIARQFFNQYRVVRRLTDSMDDD